MKKITIILVSLIFAAAILAVGILGVLSEIHNVTVEVEAIVLTQARNLPAGQILTYPEGTTVLDSDYAIFSRPKEGEPSQSEFPIEWNIAGISYDYVIQMRGYKAIMDDAKWKDGQGNFDLSAFVLPENATVQTLHYALVDSDGGVPSDMSISEQGLIHFKSKRNGVFTFDARISATDNSYKVCNVHFIAVGY